MKNLAASQKILAFFLGVMLIGSLAAAILVRGSYTDGKRQLLAGDELRVGYMDSSAPPESNYNSLWSAEIIVKAKTAKDYPVASMETIISTLTVTESYKGNLAPGDEFMFMQDCRLSQATKDSETAFYAYCITNIMQPDREYIVFAHRRDTNKAYAEKEKVPVLVPFNLPAVEVTDFGQVSYFAAEPTQSSVIDSDALLNRELRYAQIRDNEVNSTSQQAIDSFYALKGRVTATIERDY